MYLKDIQSFGSIEEKKVFGQNGEWRKWILEHDVVTQIDSRNIFLHAGISESFSDIAIEELNTRVHKALLSDSTDAILGRMVHCEYRGYLLKEEEKEKLLCGVGSRPSKYNAQRMIVGHTTQRSGEIGVRCEGKNYWL